MILQHNFETGGRNYQLGKWRPTWDYWLSYAGPSDLFRDCARAAARHGTRISAKLQVGCSHEVATTQVVPAPGILYRKYRSMHRLGVSAAMHSWYFGAYPSLMTKAAGELSFAPFPPRENEFLLSLAQRDWGRHADDVVRAWQCFRRGYSQYPTAHIFGYYGPMHNGPVWPLYLVPRRRPLAQNWKIDYPPSGDYIAECIANGFTLPEILSLCRRMAATWDWGIRMMQRLKKYFKADPDRLQDIGITTALGLQFRSGYNILKFYALREILAERRRPAPRRRVLRAMKAIVRDELKIDEALLPLAEADSMLGFHSEAEGYKYFPDLIRWRMNHLRRLLKVEFSEVERRARRPAPLFPDYTGERPTGAIYACWRSNRAPYASGGVWEARAWAECAHWVRKQGKPDRRVMWQAAWDSQAIYFRIRCRLVCATRAAAEAFSGNGLALYLEPRRTQPRIIFQFKPDGSAFCVKDDGYIPQTDNPWRAGSRLDKDSWSVTLRIPWPWLGIFGRSPRRSPIRVNVMLTMPLTEKGHSLPALCSWQQTQPLKRRLGWGNLNPAADFGWLRFEVAQPGDEA